MKNNSDLIFTLERVLVEANPRKLNVSYTVDIAPYFEESSGPFKPTWVKHRWHYCGRKYRSLRQLKSEFEYKARTSFAEVVKRRLCEADSSD